MKALVSERVQRQSMRCDLGTTTSEVKLQARLLSMSIALKNKKINKKGGK